MTSDRKKLEEELNALDGRRQQRDAAIRDAQSRQRYSPEPGAANRASAEEAALAKELDLLMTRYRALEGRLLRAQSGQKPPW